MLSTGYAMLLVYLTEEKFRTWNQLTTAEAHSSSAVSWSLTVPITAFKNTFFLLPVQTPVEHCGAKWMGLVTLQNRMLALREEPGNGWEIGERWLLPTEGNDDFFQLSYVHHFYAPGVKCRQPHAWYAHNYTGYINLSFPELICSFPACVDMCRILLGLMGRAARLAIWQVLLPSPFVLLAL